MTLRFLEDRKTAIIVSIAMLVVAFVGIFLCLVSDMTNNLRYFTIENGSYYLDGAKKISSREESNWLAGDGDLHLKLQPQRALEMSKQKYILKDCGSKKKQGCPDKTWQTYAYYNEVIDNGDELISVHPGYTPFIGENTDEQRVLCTYNTSSNNNYGLCIDPKTGDLWYRYFSF